MEKTETDFSEMCSGRTRGNSHKLQQGTFHPHMGKMGEQMSVRGPCAGTRAQAGCGLSNPGDLLEKVLDNLGTPNIPLELTRF